MKANSLVRSFILPAFAAVVFCLAGCSGEDGKDGISGTDGADGKNAAEVNVDSLAGVLRDEITGTLWDSLYAKPYVDSVYNILFDNALATAWMDSVRDALVDSLKEADYDSLYAKLYDSVYADIYSQQVIRTLEATVWSSKDDINGAFANQYPTMYKNFTDLDGFPYPVPISLKVYNNCDRSNSQIPCRWKKVMVKAWIDGYTDTSAVTASVNPDTSVILAPTLTFDNDALVALKVPEAAKIEVQAYALENDREILFYSTAKNVTMHPMQVYGPEYNRMEHRRWWFSVWVTPDMDSLDAIVKEVSKKLPDGVLKVYQQYSGDADVAASSKRVVKAVYEVLQSRNITYIQDDGAATDGQRIQYPVEVLRNRKGICCETSYLFASVLERLGYDVVLVFIPGHTYMGWRTEKGGNVLDFLETTLVGSESSFAYANNRGIEEYNEEVESGNFESGASELVDLEQARAYGIMPNNIP